jgi:serpin B
MKQIGLIIILVAALTLSSCQAGLAAPTAPATNPRSTLPPSNPPPTLAPTKAPPSMTAPSGDVLASARQRVTDPGAPPADLRDLAHDNTAFAVDLYRALLKDNQGNLIFSPYSISLALAMTYAGARGQTEQQMAQTLHFTLPQARLHPAFNALDLALSPGGTGAASDQFQLSIANSLWGQKGFPFESAFLDQLAENYGAGLRLADFAQAPEPARNNINDWVSQQTKNKINDLIPAGAIDPLTRLVLANAIYFKAKWVSPFDANLTRPGDFNLLDGTKASVSMMSASHVESLRYAQGNGYQAVELPYQGDKAAMIIIVPDARRFADVQKALTADSLDALANSLQPRQVQLTMPKFKTESSISLAGTLAQLGMPDAVNPDKADFSGMDGAHDLYVSAVLHKAYVAVDEAGTEAAAATAVVVGVMAMPVVDIQLTVDRPFIYLIRDTQTGSLLFMGQVTHPQ